MTDASLDDFFAKKDKTKKKSKSKLTPDELLEQQQESSMKKLKKKKKKQESTEGGSKTVVKEDEEWIDYVNEEEKDLSGLRIKELQIQREEDEVGKQEEEDQEEEEDGETSEKREGSAGPWNRSQHETGGAVQPTTPEPAPEPEPELKVEEKLSEPVKSGKYVPPSLRGSAAGGSSAVTPVNLAAQRRRKKEAPNLRSEEDFPTLGGDGTPVRDREAPARDFTRVRTGGKQTEESQSQGPKLELGNRYNALQSS